MTTYNGMAGYRSAYDDYEDEDLDPEQLHPNIRRQARKIVLKERTSLLMKWWISLIGTSAILACMVAVVLSGIGLIVQATATAMLSAITIIYLISLAHRPALKC
jgi:hypothetical protein